LKNVVIEPIDAPNMFDTRSRAKKVWLGYWQAAKEAPDPAGVTRLPDASAMSQRSVGSS